jgi:hypothetical protein
VSGLAVTANGRLFAHGDEEGTIHQVDPRAGTLIKSFTLAAGNGTVDLGKKQKKGPLAGDFEDLAIVGDRFYLVTSNGMLVEFAEGADGAEVPVTIHRTTLGETCEIEGLEHDAAGNALLLLCKTMRSKSERGQVAVYAWSLAERTLDPTPRLTVPWDALAPVTGGRAFNASALALIPGGRSLALVAGPQRLFAEVTSGGAAVTGGALQPGLHPQPEGVAFLPDGTLLLSSEGGKGEASLSGYPPH